MVRHYVKKRITSYTEEDLKMCMVLHKTEKRSIHSLSREFNIQLSTLRKHCIRGDDMKIGSGGSLALPTDVENEVIHCMLVASQNGTPYNKTDLADAVERHVTLLGLQTPFVNNRPGNDWMTSFYCRNKDVLSLNNGKILINVNFECRSKETDIFGDVKLEPKEEKIDSDAHTMTYNFCENDSNHSDSSESEEVCEHCGRSLCSKYSLNKHKLRMHADDTNVQFTCKVVGCEKKFISRSAFNTHVNVHNKTVTFQCDKKDCKKTFLNKCNLNIHVKAVHDKKRFECPVPNCGKSYCYKKDLTRHSHEHGNTVHVCDKCGKDFKIKSNLTRHGKTCTGKK